MKSNFGKVKKFHFVHKNSENLDKSEREKQALTQVLHTRSPLNFQFVSWIEDTGMDFY